MRARRRYWPKSRSIFITFSGIDGSGKSTLAYDARDILEEIGIDAQVVWGAYSQVLFRPLIRFVKKLTIGKTDPFKDYDSYYSSMQRIGKKRIVSLLFYLCTLTEYFVQIIFKISFPLSLGRTIVCDRYVFDTITNFSANLNLSFQKHRRIIDFLLKICPKPNLSFYVDVPEQVAMSRKNDVFSIEYLKLRKPYYDFNCRFYQMVKLDGTLELSNLHRIIEDILRCSIRK